MAVSVAVLRARFRRTLTDPPFTDTDLANAIAAANLRIDPDVWTTCTDEGCAFLAAHLALIDPKGSSSGVKSATAGKVKIDFDRSKQAQIFREEYERLQRGVTPVVFIGGSLC